MQTNIAAPIGAEPDSRASLPGLASHRGAYRQRPPLTESEIELLAQKLAPLVASRVIAELRATPAPAPMAFCPLALSVREFGIAINRCPKVVRRRIQERFIDRAHISGPPYTIAREALAKFKVSFPLAVERLANAAKTQPSEGGAS